MQYSLEKFQNDPIAQSGQKKGKTLIEWCLTRHPSQKWMRYIMQPFTFDLKK